MKKLASSRHQTGAVLLIAMIVLIAMTLSALALIRSVNMTNLIAGNLAFRESAVLSSEHATEEAIKWLVKKYPLLNENDTENGYLARRSEPAPGENWGNYFRSRTDGVKPVVAAADLASNTVSYVIHRLCDRAGKPYPAADGVTFCSRAPGEDSGNPHDGGNVNPSGSEQIYYRITSRVTGPRNTVVYTQTLVAL